MNVKIISDSTCDLSSELLSRYDIDIGAAFRNAGRFYGPRRHGSDPGEDLSACGGV